MQLEKLLLLVGGMRLQAGSMMVQRLDDGIRPLEVLVGQPDGMLLLPLAAMSVNLLLEKTDGMKHRLLVG